MKRRSMRFFATFALGCLVLAWPSPARAEPTKDECVDAYKKNQPLRRDGHFREAIELLLVCAREPCPAVLHADCMEWLDDAKARAPSFVVKAHSGTSTHLTSVRVSVDGVEVATHIDGRALDVDVGEHVFAFEQPGGPRVEKKLLVLEGEKSRVIDVDLTPEPLVAPAAARPVPWPVFALGGLGVAGLGAGSVFGVMGITSRNDLFDCRPGCDQRRIDDVAHTFLVADVSLAIGVASLAAATLLYWTRPSASSRSEVGKHAARVERPVVNRELVE